MIDSESMPGPRAGGHTGTGGPGAPGGSSDSESDSEAD